MASAPLVFVFGTGRCGTHSLWKLFESVPGTISLHEGAGMLAQSGGAARRIALGPLLEWNAYLYHLAGEGMFRRSFSPDEDMMAKLDRHFAPRANLIGWCQQQGVAFCASNPYLYNCIDYLRIRYPAAKFIHLVRDGYACVRSWGRRLSTYPEHMPELAAVGYALAKPVPLPSDPTFAAWPSFDRTERISWFWANVNANILDRMSRVPPGNALLLRIEDLDDAAAREVLRFCGMREQWSATALQAHDASSGPSIDWTPDNVAKFNALAGPMMRTLGYPLR